MVLAINATWKENALVHFVLLKYVVELYVTSGVIGILKILGVKVMGDKRKVNPCKLCIIGPICKEPCNELVEYLKTNIIDDDCTGDGFFSSLARSIKRGDVILHDNDTNWAGSIRPSYYGDEET